MVGSSGDRRSLEQMLREDTDVEALGREYAQVVGVVVEDARAEASAAGRQARGIHAMWRVQRQAHEQRRAVLVRWAGARNRVCGRELLEDRSLQEVAEEIGPLLRLPAVTALHRVETAVVLAGCLPAVLEALEGGAIGWRQAEVLAGTWVELAGSELRPAPDPRPPVEVAVRVVEELLGRAPVSTPAQLRAAARRRREGVLAASRGARHREALAGRRVWVEAEEDGMARLCAVLEAATAHAVHARLVAIAGRVDPAGPVPGQDVGDDVGQEVGRGLEPGPGQGTGHGGGAAEDGPGAVAGGATERRTPVQVRADVLADLLLEGEPPQMPERLRGIRGQVAVTVPVLALLEHTGRLPGPGRGPDAASGGEPPDPAGGGPSGGGPPGSWGSAELEGYGPIPVETAARIAATAPSWTRILTDPVTGTVVDHDRATYTVPADLDHTVAWAEGGTTAAGNLAHLCRAHHRLKHREGPLGRWRVRHRDPRTPDGVLEWTSPAGRVHVSYPREHHHPALSPARIPGLRPEDSPAPAPPPGDPPDEAVPHEAPPQLWQLRQVFDLPPQFDDPPPF